MVAMEIFQEKAVFRSRVVSPDSVFVFYVKNCPKNDKLDSKCPSRKVQQNCAISF
jgi:hypothetical protein